jgi:hypothetical protein
MTRYLTLAPLALIVVSLLGCDQAGELSAPKEADADLRAATAKIGKKIGKKCGCWDVEATLFTAADFETFTAEGTIVGDLEGSVSITGDPNSLTPVSSDVFPPVNPATLSFTTQLEITTEEGALTTRVVGVIESGPFGAAAEFHRVLSGTGAYAGATGTLYANSVADETGASFVEHLSGQICTPCEKDEDDQGDEDDQN